MVIIWPKTIAPVTMKRRVAVSFPPSRITFQSSLGGESSVDEGTNEQAINHSHPRRFGGGKDPGIDPAENNNRRHEAPKGLFESFPPFLPGSGFNLGCEGLISKCPKDNVDAEKHRQHDPGKHPGHEEFTHGIPRDRSDQNEKNTWGD